MVTLRTLLTHFLNNVLLVKENVPTVDKKRFLLVLPYLGIISLQTRTRKYETLRYKIWGAYRCVTSYWKEGQTIK